MPTCLICPHPPTKRDGYDRRGCHRYTCRRCRRDFIPALRFRLPRLPLAGLGDLGRHALVPRLPALSQARRRTPRRAWDRCLRPNLPELGPDFRTLLAKETDRSELTASRSKTVAPPPSASSSSKPPPRSSPACSATTMRPPLVSSWRPGAPGAGTLPAPAVGNGELDPGDGPLQGLPRLRGLRATGGHRLRRHLLPEVDLRSASGGCRRRRPPRHHRCPRHK